MLKHYAANIVSDWPIFYVQIATIAFMSLCMFAVVTAIRWDNEQVDEHNAEMEKTKEKLRMKDEDYF